MAKYAFLINVRDTVPIWVDHDLSTSGEAIAIADTYATSGVTGMSVDPNTKADIYTLYPEQAINNIKIYMPIV